MHFSNKFQNMSRSGFYNHNWPENSIILFREVIFLIDNQKTLESWLFFKFKYSYIAFFAYVFKYLKVFYLNNLVLLLNKKSIDCISVRHIPQVYFLRLEL